MALRHSVPHPPSHSHSHGGHTHTNHGRTGVTAPGVDDEEGPEAALRKLTQMPGVMGYVILNKSGIPVKYVGMESAEAIHYAGLISELTISTREFLEKKIADPHTDDTEVVTIRLRTRKHEIVITPEENYTLIVIHNPNQQDGITQQTNNDKNKTQNTNPNTKETNADAKGTDREQEQ